MGSNHSGHHEQQYYHGDEIQWNEPTPNSLWAMKTNGSNQTFLSRIAQSYPHTKTGWSDAVEYTAKMLNITHSQAASMLQPYY